MTSHYKIEKDLVIALLFLHRINTWQNLFFFFFFAAGPKDTPMEFVWEQTYDAKTGKGMPDL